MTVEKVAINGADQFDYIVVGAGSAGCAIAARLTEDPGNRVCLIEAGPSDLTPLTKVKARVPVGGAAFRMDKKFNWLFSYEAEARLGNKPIPCPRGKLFGGSSSINGMVYIRGHKLDFERWKADGNKGWGWDEVLPFFKKSEDWERGADAYHGAGGELSVTEPRYLHPLSRAFLEAAAECQLPRNDDFNGPVQEGFGPYPRTQWKGERWSSARAFLHPALHRRNLTVISDALAERVLFEGKRATGLRIRINDLSRDLAARKEVILAAGAIGSPHILLLSGIGPAKELAEKGIPVVHDLPGVGENLHDHPAVNLYWADKARVSLAATPRGLLRVALSPLAYFFGRSGFLGTNVVEAGGFIRSAPDVAHPDVQFVFAPMALNRDVHIPRMHGFLLQVGLLRPTSRGKLSLHSADPAAAPRLVSNFMADPAEIKTMIRGIRVARQIIGAGALSAYRGAEQAPGAGAESDAEIEAFICNNMGTVFHPVGTCKMGVGADAVVDPELRVHGIEGLRVADASIMPSIVSGNTNAPSIMIGERCADFIRRAA